MNEIATTSSSALVVPTPRRVQIATRVATSADLPFLDAMQKAHGRALGFFPRAQMEGYVENQWVLIAEAGGGGSEVGGRDESSLSPPTTHYPRPTPVGYCASRDRYLKRDELGVIYQLCVTPGHQRGLIGATLIKEVFARAAYGCRLFCCWCAQDLASNHFWEALGFVPIAYRAGGRKGRGARGKGRGKEMGPSSSSLAPDPLPHAPSARVHIFWQRRIREGDTTTPWWFPAKTDQGAMREDRLVLPIPPGLHWSDPMPVLKSDAPEGQRESRKRVRAKSEAVTPPKPRGGVVFSAPPPDGAPEPIPAPPAQPEPTPAKAARPKEKIDPQLIAKARELRDRYLEQVNDRLLIASGGGKYDVSRSLPPMREASPTPLLPAA
jgi:hypothetical protein